MMIPRSPAIALPQLNAAEAIAMILALGAALRGAQAAQVRSSEERAANARGRRREAEPAEGAAVPVPVPGNVTACMKRLESAGEALSQARLAGARRAEDRANRAARRRLLGRHQRAWTALRTQVKVWREIGALAKAPEARRQVIERLFPAEGGGRPPGGSARRAWTESHEALGRIKAEGGDAALGALGGAAVLAHLEAVHGELGAALGVTAATPAEAPSGGAVASALAAAQSLLREYVLKVHAMVDPEAPGSEALAAALLAPLAKPRRAARPAGAKAAGAQEPAAPAAPQEPAAPALRPTGSG